MVSHLSAKERDPVLIKATISPIKNTTDHFRVAIALDIQDGWHVYDEVPEGNPSPITEVSSEAERFIRENAARAKGGKPFFLYLALTAPHTPTSPSGKFAGNSSLGIYGDFVMETDDCIGRVLSALDAQGLAEDTLVIATSDHGAAPYAGRRREATFLQLKELEKDGHYSSGPFRGYKFSVYEGGFRVPFVARWPAVVPPQSTCDKLVGLQDLMATIAEITDTKLAADEAPDSISMLPLLTDPATKATRTSMAFEATRARAIRVGSWKLALCPGSGCEGRFGNAPPREQAWRDAVKRFGRTPRSHAELQQAPFLQLFNLDRDPGEANNLAADQPARVRQMIALLETQITSGRSTPGSSLTNENQNIKLFSAVPAFVWKAVP
jgi:arylsulfatase A-like enzyme